MATSDELLQTALHHLDFRCRQAALAELVRLSPPELVPVCESLLGCFRNPTVHLERRALQVMTALGTVCSPCLPNVLEALQDSHWTVREVAAQALGAMG